MSAAHWPTLAQIGLVRRSAASGDLLLDGALVVRSWVGAAQGSRLDWTDALDGASLEGADAPLALASCALGVDRLLWIASDRTLWSSAAGGQRPRKHGRIALRAGEGPRWMRAGEGLALLVESDDDEEGASNRVSAIELDGCAVRWTLPFGWVSMVASDGGRVWVLDRDIEDDRRETLVCVDAKTAQILWRWTFDAAGDEDAERSGPLVWLGPEVIIGGSVVALDRERGAVRWMLDEGRVVGRAGDRVLVARSWRSLDVRAAQTGALLARFALQGAAVRTCAIDDSRVAVSTHDALWVLDVEEGRILAAERIGVRATSYPRLDARGAVIVHEPRERWTGDPRVERGEQLRVARAIEPERAQWSEPFEQRQAAYVELPVDKLRLAQIVAVLREEQGDREAAWERLEAQGMIDPRMDRQRFSLLDRRGASGLDAPELWCALAHDSSILCEALTLCDELRHAVRPWTGALRERVVLELDGFDTWGSERLLVRWLLAALSEIADAPWPDDRAPEALVALDAAWRRAADEGLRFADSAPRMLADTLVSAHRSPVAPWLALVALGFAPSLHSDEVHLAYVAMNEALDGRAALDDVPF